MILKSGTGDFKGAGGVKTAKLDVKQDQIGEHCWIGNYPNIKAARLRFPGQIA